MKGLRAYGRCLGEKATVSFKTLSRFVKGMIRKLQSLSVTKETRLREGRDKELVLGFGDHRLEKLMKGKKQVWNFGLHFGLHFPSQSMEGI